MTEKSDFDFEGDDEAIFDDKGTPNVNDSEEEATDETIEEDELMYMDDDEVADDEGEEELELEGEEEGLEESEEDVSGKTEEETKEADVEGDPYNKIREDIIKTLPDGEDTLFIVKGKEYRAADIPAKEWVNVLQKGLRADQLFAEMGERRRTLEQEQELARQATAQAQRLLDEYGRGGKAKVQETTSVPDFLKPNELDTEEMKLLKQYAADVTNRVATLESGVQNSEVKQYENEILNEVKTLSKEFPVASVDEVLAVKSLYPKEKIEDLMRLSNQYYSSLEFLQKALEANPTAARELEEKIVKKHYAKKGKPRNVGVKRSRTSGSKKVSTKPTKKPGFDFGFDDAEEGARDYLTEIKRLRSL